MKTIYNIAKAELQMLFYSPIAWLILIIFVVQTALRFSTTLDNMVWSQEVGGALNAGLTENLFPSIFTGVFPTILGNLYLYIPLLTMGLISREYSSGSIRLLYSSPITNSQIVLGKFLAMMLFGLLLVGIILVYVGISWATVKDFDLPAVLVGVLGCYFLICTYSAVGIFMSSMTSYQVVAAISTLVTLGLLSAVGGWWQHIDWVRDITWWLSISGRAQEFVNGLLCSEDVIYFVLVTLMFLIFTIIHLEGKRTKISRLKTWGKYLGVFAVIAVIGFVTSRPSMRSFYDATATKHNTLTPASQEIVSQLKGGLKVTTYVNVLDPDFGYFFPKFKNEDLDRFKQYTRFKPEMKFDYVYYYDDLSGKGTGGDESALREQMKEVMRVYHMDTSAVLTPSEIRQLEDLSVENNRIVRVLERESGEKVFLRIFNDQAKFPHEEEISIAMKHLVTDMPTVGFVKGHGERSSIAGGERDYQFFTNNKPYRNALINQGYDFKEISLTEPIPEEIEIIVLADVKNSFTEEETKHWNEYVERGGNILILADLNRQETMNPLVKNFGIEFLPGVLVSLSEQTLPDLIVSQVTSEAAKLGTSFYGQAGLPVTMPGCLGMRCLPVDGYELVPVMKTSQKAWNETEIMDFLENTPKCEITKGEIEDMYTTAAALRRKIGGKEQRIMIMADADCFSNGELTLARKNVGAYNFSTILSVFYWLGNEQAPLDTTRPPKTDDAVYLDEGGMKVVKFMLDWGFPLFLLLAGVIVWIRRRAY